MALANMKNIYFTIDEELLLEVEKYRSSKVPAPDRSEVLRELVKIGLTHAPE